MHDFFQHKTGRVIIIYANLKIGFYDLHKKRKKSLHFRRTKEIFPTFADDWFANRTYC